MFVRPPHLLPKLKDDNKVEVTNRVFLKSLQALQQSQRTIHQMTQGAMLLATSSSLAILGG